VTRFLVKAGFRPRGRNSVVVADDLMVEHPVKFRRKGQRNSPLGLITEMESTGKRDPGRFKFVVREGTLGTGREAPRSRSQTEAPATAAETKKVIRVLRPQEEEKIAVLDKLREDLRAKLAAAETERDELVREAFSRGNVVRLSELEAMAEEEDRIWKERKRLLNSLGQRTVAELRELLESESAKADTYIAQRIQEELEGRE